MMIFMMNRGSPRVDMARWRKLTGAERIVYPYRYLSWFISSIFYLLYTPPDLAFYKWLIVGSLLVETIVATSMYRRYQQQSYMIHLLILTETLGMTFLLAPTGGIESPFVWYALNSVLIAAALLRPIYAWIYLVFYAVVAIASYALLFSSGPIRWLTLIEQYSNTLLVFLLMTFALQLFASLTRDLVRQSRLLEQQTESLHQATRKLAALHQRERKSMKQLVGLYKMLQTVTSQDDVKTLLNVLCLSASRMVNGQRTFLWSTPEDGSVGSPLLATSFTNQPDAKTVEPMLMHELSLLWQYDAPTSTPTERRIGDVDYLICSIQSSFHRYGFLGMQLAAQPRPHGETIQTTPQAETAHSAVPSRRTFSRLLKMVADLSALVLERVKLEQLAGQRLVTQEQNRIANEIHDNVSQRLFSVAYALYALGNTWSIHAPAEVGEQLQAIRKTADEANREFRQFIYNLSPRETITSSLTERVRTFLSDMEQLNQVAVNYSWNGVETAVPLDIQQSLYRVISEASINAVRHGKCTALHVHLHFTQAASTAVIGDNGQGFNTTGLRLRTATGLGLRNMEQIALDHGGTFAIESQIGEGTKIRVTLLNSFVPADLGWKKGEVW